MEIGTRAKKKPHVSFALVPVSARSKSKKITKPNGNACYAGSPRQWLNYVPRVLRLFGQRLVVRGGSGVLEFYNRRISAVKQWKPLRSSQSKNLHFFEFSRVSPGAYPLTKKPEDSRNEIGSSLMKSEVALSIHKYLVFINKVDKVNWPPKRESRAAFRALALIQGDSL